MTGNRDEARALIDLGLMTRVACHELNNLIANQRGYSRLLLQRGDGTAESRRWLTELAAASDGLHHLVGQLQQWSRCPVPAGQPPSPAWVWPPAHALQTLARALSAQGCALSEVALQRLLGIVSGLAAAAAEDWSAVYRGEPPPHGALLGLGERDRPMLGVDLPDHSGDLEASAWAAAADLILPAADAAPDAWLRALVLGLLRQCGGDLCVTPGPQRRIALWLPMAFTDLEIR